MTKLAQITTFVVVLALFAVPAFSDTLVLKNGEKIAGYFEGGSARVIKFRATDGVVKDYDLLSVQQIQFGDEKSASTVSTPPSTSTSSSTSTTSRATNSPDPRLLPKTDRVTQPTSSNAASTAWTIPTGSKIVIRMIDPVNSEKNQIGDTFAAVLGCPFRHDP